MQISRWKVHASYLGGDFAQRTPHNLKAVQQHIGPDVTVCAVVKADAYGHGSVGCARVLEGEGVQWFGVTGTEEGVRLRDGGIHGRVLLLSGFWQGEAEEVVHQRLTPATYDLWQITPSRRSRREGCSTGTVSVSSETRHGHVAPGHQYERSAQSR